MALVCDLAGLPEPCCNDGLEFFAKAMAEDPHGLPDSIWRLHENPWLRAHVEDMSGRWARILELIQDAFARALTGQPIGDLSKAADVPWMRWDEMQFAEARQHLESKSPAEYDLDDWMLLVDYLVQRYLPDGVINSEAERLVVRAAMLGKVQATIGAGLKMATPEELAGLSELVPTRFAHVPPRALAPIEIATLRLSKQLAALHISNITEKTRAEMKGLIVEHLQAQVLGQKEGQATALRQRLFDDFGGLNRDFRRIAVTEAGNTLNNAYIATRPLGSKVRRREAYKGACDFCKSIDGHEYRIVSPDAPEKDGAKEVWLGKSNLGRSASPMRRQDGKLVPRESAELWWCAAGVQHPHCRGAWEDVIEKPANVDPAFHEWMMGTLAKAGLKPIQPATPDDR